MGELRLNAAGADEIVRFKTMMDSARKALELLPAGADRDVFLEKLDTAEFFGTRALVSKPGNYVEKSGE